MPITSAFSGTCRRVRQAARSAAGNARNASSARQFGMHTILAGETPSSRARRAATLARQEPRQADALPHCGRTVHVPQRQMHQPDASLLVAGSQWPVRLKMNHGQLEPLGAQMLSPPNRVELGAADLEIVDAVREPNHGSPNSRWAGRGTTDTRVVVPEDLKPRSVAIAR